MKKYEFLDHPADIKIKSYGKNLAELFVNSALGMMVFLYGADELKNVKITHHETVEIEGENLENLLINWLFEILTCSDISNRAYLEFEIKKITSHKVLAQIGSGEALAKDEIKAVTYHDLFVTKVKNAWEAIVVYDI